jgi:hypothetical protein
MEKKRFESEDFFEGVWTVTQIYKKHGFTWKPLSGYKENGLVWTFFGTVMITEETGNEELTSKYIWYPKRRELLIARDEERIGAFFELLGCRNRIEQISDTECFAFGLRDVINEPEDYWVKIHIRRVVAEMI